MKAADVVQQVRADLRRVDEEIRRHPYLDALEKGDVQRDQLKAFPGHEYHIVSSDVRSMAMMLHRFGDPTAREFFNGVVQGELAGLRGVVALGAKLTPPSWPGSPSTPRRQRSCVACW